MVQDGAGPLVVLVGAPGSGKSTWAKKHFPAAQIVSSDALRRTISGDAGNPAASERAMRIRDEIVRGRMWFGQTTVVDSTSAYTADREHLARMRFETPGMQPRPAIAVIFDTPVEECLARNNRRPLSRRVPEADVRERHAAIEDALPVASTWAVAWFDIGVRIRPDGVWYMGGRVTALRALPWLLEQARSLANCPDWVGLPGENVAALL